MFLKCIYAIIQCTFGNSYLPVLAESMVGSTLAERCDSAGCVLPVLFTGTRNKCCQLKLQITECESVTEMHKWT